MNLIKIKAYYLSFLLLLLINSNSIFAGNFSQTYILAFCLPENIKVSIPEPTNISIYHNAAQIIRLIDRPEAINFLINGIKSGKNPEFNSRLLFDFYQINRSNLKQKINYNFSIKLYELKEAISVFTNVKKCFYLQIQSFNASDLIIAISFLFLSLLLFAFLAKRKTEKKFEQLSNATFEAIVIHENGNILEANTKFEEISGFSINNLKGISVFEFINLKDYDKIRDKKEIDSDDFYETLFTTKTGVQLNVEFLERPYQYNNKMVNVIALRDITQFRKILDNNIILSTAVEQSANTIVITDTTGKIIYVNPHFQTLTGYTREEAIGLNPRVLKSGNQTREYYENLWNTILDGRTWKGEFHNRKKNGDLFWEEATITPIINSYGKLVNFIAIKENITHRKTAEAALKQSEQQLRELNATKDKFFSIIAHDLRGPIGNIKVFIEFILGHTDLSEHEQIKTYLELLLENANSTFDLLENLLVWARSQRHEMNYLPEKIDVADLADKTIDLILTMAKGKGIELKSLIKKDTLINADKNMISSIIRNLLSNAIKFTEENGQISMSSQDAGNFIEFSVIDNGIGIKEDDLPRIFNKLEHFTTYGTKNEKGQGLGLMLCMEFIEKHGGKIWVESNYGKGTTFKFTLPKYKENVKST